MSTRWIRAAVPGDAASVLEIYAPIVRDTAISFEHDVPTREEMAERIDRVLSGYPWLVMEIGGHLAGYAYGSSFRGRTGYRATVEVAVYVHERFQRQGVARELMESLIGELAARGYRQAVAVIALPNAGSVALHESLGFTHAGTLHGVGWKFDQWHDEGFWERRLTPG